MAPDLGYGTRFPPDQSLFPQRRSRLCRRFDRRHRVVRVLRQRRRLVGRRNDPSDHVARHNEASASNFKSHSELVGTQPNSSQKSAVAHPKSNVHTKSCQVSYQSSVNIFGQISTLWRNLKVLGKF